MDGWMDGWIDEWMDGHVRMYVCMSMCLCEIKTAVKNGGSASSLRCPEVAECSTSASARRPETGLLNVVGILRTGLHEPRAIPRIPT